jgi:hypothetical protein
MSEFNPSAALPGIPDQAAATHDRLPSLSRTVWANDYPDEATETFKAPAPKPRQPGRRTGATVIIGQDGEAEVLRENDGVFFNAGGSQARFVHDAARPAKAPSGPIVPTFQTTHGSPVRAKDITDTTLVINPITGEVESDVASLLRAGLLRETKDGFELVGPDGKFHSDRAKARPKTVTKSTVEADDADAEGDTEADTKSPSKSEPAAPQRSYLAHHEEAALVEAERQIGEQTFSALEAAFTETGSDLETIPAALVANVARSLGVDADGAKAAISQQAGPLSRQAHQAVASMVGDSEAAFNWARNDPAGRQLLASAIRGQLNERSLAGFKSVAHGYLAHLCKTPEGREAVAEGIRAGGHNRVKIEGGKVLIDLGKAGGGWTEFTSALRGGVIGARR